MKPCTLSILRAKKAPYTTESIRTLGFWDHLGPPVSKGLVRVVLQPGNALLPLISAITSTRRFKAPGPVAHSGPISSPTSWNASLPLLRSVSITVQSSFKNGEIRFPLITALKGILQKCLFFSFYRNSPTVPHRHTLQTVLSHAVCPSSTFTWGHWRKEQNLGQCHQQCAHKIRTTANGKSSKLVRDPAWGSNW